MPPAKCDVIPKEQFTPFAERRACSGCRKIKSRCIFPDDSNNCTRCLRLSIECVVPSHHRGVKLEGQRSKSSSSITPLKRRSSKSQSRESASPSPNDDMDASSSASVNPFSVQSLLDTTSSESTASQALLSSTMHSHIQEEPAVKVASAIVGRPLIESVITAGLFDEEEVVELVRFYYEHLNPVIALLDSQIYTLKALKSNPDYRILLAAVCTVSSKFVKVDRYLDALEFLKPALSRVGADDIAPQLEIIQSLSILAMWKHPKDGSSWRKVRLAITQAFELGLHELFGPQKRSKSGPSRSFIQSQRTLMQLSCFEDGYRDQRHLPPAIDPSLLPDPREWIDSLGDMVQDIDVRLAASRENANIKRDLITSLKHSNNRSPTPGQISRATCLRNARLIKMGITAQTCSSSVWMNPPASEIPCQHSGRPCLIFHDTNTLFNYHRALYSIYSSPQLSGPAFADDRQAAFQKCSELSVRLFELLNGVYGQAGYYRYVHDIVILNLAVAAVWICDNWRAMPHELATQACLAIRQAADATSPSLEHHLEQGSYLARFLRFCCKKLPSTISINENSPINAEDLVISEDAKWAMGMNPFTQMSNHAFGRPPSSSGPPGPFRSPYIPGASPINANGNGMPMPQYGGPHHGSSNGNGAHHGMYHSAGSQASGSPSLVSTSSPQGAQSHFANGSANGGDPSLIFSNGHSNGHGHGHGHGHHHGHGQPHGRPPHHQSASMNNQTLQYLSESLVPPAYPMNWDTYDDNSIITFLQSISSASGARPHSNTTVNDTVTRKKHCIDEGTSYPAPPNTMTTISGPSVNSTTTKPRSTKLRKSQTRQHQLRWIHLIDSWHSSSESPRDQLVEEISQHAQTLCRTITDRSWLIDAFHLAIDAVLFPTTQPEDSEELERIEQLGQQLLQLAVHSVASAFLASLRPDDDRCDTVKKVKDEWERLARRLSMYQRLRGTQLSIPVLPLTLVLRESSASVLLCLASLPQASEAVAPLLQHFAWLVEESAEAKLSIVAQLLSSTQEYSKLAASGVLIGWKDGKESSLWQSATSVRPRTVDDLVGFYSGVLEDWRQSGSIEQARVLLAVLEEVMQGEDGRAAVVIIQSNFFGDRQRGQQEITSVVKQRFDLSSVQDLAAKVSAAGTNNAAIKGLAREVLASHQDTDAAFSRVTQLVDTKDSVSVRTLALEVVSQASASAASRTAPLLASILYARPAVGGFRLDLNTPPAFLKRAESLLKGTNVSSGSVTGSPALGNALGQALDLDTRSVVPACQLFALLSCESDGEVWGDLERHLGWLGSLASLLDGQVDRPDVDMCWLAAYGGSASSRVGAKEKQAAAFDSILKSFNDAHPAPSSGGRLDRSTDPSIVARFRAVWEKFFHEHLSLTSHPGAPFSLVTSEEATRRLLSTVLCTGDVQLFRSLSNHTVLPPAELESLVLDVSTSLFDSAPIATARSKEIRLSQDVLLALPDNSKSAALHRDFIEASCRLSAFNIKSPSGGSLTPVETRTMKDRLKLIGIMLSTQQGAWRSSELILELARKLCGGEGRVVEGRMLAMMSEAAVAGEEDFESAARFCERLIELVKQKGKKEEEGEKEVVREIAWKTCFGVAKHPGWEDTAARVALLGQAMVMAPAGQLGGMLRVWEGLDAMLREEVEDGKWDEGRRDGWLGGLGERGSGKGAGGMGGLSASTAASVGAGLVGTAANYLPLSLGSYFGNTGATSNARGAATTSTEATASTAAGSTHGVDSRTAALFDFDSVSGAATDTAGYVDPTERAVRAARAARDFLGWKSDHQRDGEAAGAGAEGVGMGGGGFSFSRGVGWLIGDGERR